MASPGRARAGASNKPDSAGSSRNARIATAAQPVAISYTYGSPVPQNTGLEYEPLAKTKAKEKAAAAGLRSRDGSAGVGNASIDAGGRRAQDENQAGPTSLGGADAAAGQSGKSSHSKTTTVTKVTLSGSAQEPQSRARARGASLVQQGQDPPHLDKILKDTSVNIATAFRQAAGSASTGGTAVGAPGMNAASGDVPVGNGGVAFLGRAGDRDAPVHARQQHQQPQISSTQTRSVVHDEDAEEDGVEYDRSTESAETEQLHLQNTSTTTSTSLAGKKRKKGQHFKGSKEKDPAFRPPKNSNGVVSDSEEYASDDDSVDLEELRQEYGIAAPPSSGVAAAASGKAPAASANVATGTKGKQSAKPKKKARTRNDGATDEGGDVGEGEGEGSDGGDAAEEHEENDGQTAARGANRATRRRKSGPKDGAYKPGQDSEYSEDYSDIDENGGRTRRRRRKAGTSAGAGSSSINGRSVAQQRSNRDDSVLSTERGDEHEHEQEHNDEHGDSGQVKSEMTSYYLHAPSEEPSDIQTQSDRPSAPPEPDFQPPAKPGAPLATVQPKAGNNGTTYQPYFAFSTSTIGTGPGRRVAQTSTSFLRNLASGSGSSSAIQRPRAPSTSTSTGATSHVHAGNETTFNLGRALPGGYGDFSLAGRQSTTGGPSSNASFDLRGSEYDYAEEERMTNALLAARERGETGRKLPEGRQILPLGAGSVNGPRGSGREEVAQNGRGASLAPSGQSSEFSMGSAGHSQANGKPRRGPAPPNPPGLRRSTSNFSDRASQDPPATSTSTSGATAAGRGTPKQKSVGRKLGELVRKVALLVYWCVVGPITLLREMGWRSAWKWAAAIALLGLMLGSMNERATSSSASQKQHRPWYYSILPSSSSAFTQPTVHAPHTVPANIDELVSRLTNLETTFAILSQAQASDHASAVEYARQQSDSSRRLAALEGDFESERSRASKAHDGLVKASQKDSERLDAGLKGTSSQLEYLSDRLKTLATERKQDTTESARLRSEMARVNTDLAQLGKRVAGLDTEVQESRDLPLLMTLVNKRLEEMLPARMAVSIDSKTGEVKVNPRFWAHLKTALASTASSSTDGGATGGQLASWEDFLAHNEAGLRRVIDSGVQDHITKGAIVSKASFLEVLERDLLSLRNEISRTSSDGLAKLSSEFSGKLSKLTHSASRASSSPSRTKVKLSSGEDLDALVAPLIDAALARYSKDVLARPDFALYTSGGRVIPSLTSPTYEVRPPGSALSPSRLLGRLTGLGVLRGKPPVTALHPDIAVGQCWPFAGRSGQLGILLSRHIVPTEITLEHAAKEIALDVTSAPKRFEVWALVEEHEGRERLAAYNEQQENAVKGSAPLDRQLLLEGEYDASKENHIQTFAVPQEIQDLQIPVGVVLLRIIDNHGNEDLSCLYRVRVGGTPARDSLPQASASISVEELEEA